MTETYVSKANEVIESLKTALLSSGFSLVSLRRLDINELSDTEFDAVVIIPGRETQRIMNQGQVDAEWFVTLNLFTMKGGFSTALENWNEKAAMVGRIISTDRTLGGTVISAEITGKSRNMSVYEPFASGTIEMTLHFRFNERTQGG